MLPPRYVREVGERHSNWFWGEFEHEFLPQGDVVQGRKILFLLHLVRSSVILPALGHPSLEGATSLFLFWMEPHHG